MNVGDKLPLSEKQADKISEIFSAYRHLTDAIEELAIKAGRKNDEAWGLIKKMFPEYAYFGMKYICENGKTSIIITTVPDEEETPESIQG